MQMMDFKPNQLTTALTHQALHDFNNDDWHEVNNDDADKHVSQNLNIDSGNDEDKEEYHIMHETSEPKLICQKIYGTRKLQFCLKLNN